MYIHSHLLLSQTKHAYFINSQTEPTQLRNSPALTSRGFTEEDFAKVADFFDRSVKIAQAIKKETGPKIKDFRCVFGFSLCDALVLAIWWADDGCSVPIDGLSSTYHNITHTARRSRTGRASTPSW